MKILKFCILALLTALYSPFQICSAQTAESSLKASPFSLSLELMTRDVWRGQEFGDAPVSMATLSYTADNFCAWALGGYAVNGSHQEVDLGVTYTLSDVLVGLSDYYYPSAVGTDDNYFDFDNHTSGHWGELYATYTPSKLPIWITVSAYVYGSDKKADGKQAYSSYAEAGYTYSFKDTDAISLAVGANLNKGYYTDYKGGINIVTASIKYTKHLKIGNFEMPVSGAYIVNPYREKSFFTFSISHTF